jgi:FlgD Ig-like domain
MKHGTQAAILGLFCTALVAGPAAAVITDTTIYNIQQGLVALNDTVRVQNVVVTGVDVKPSTFGVYIQEQAGGAYSGILAYRGGVFPAYANSADPVTVGDVVTVVGWYTEFSGLSELNAPTLTKTGTTTPLTPVTLPVDSIGINYPGAERWEGVLVRVDNVRVTSVNTFNDWRVRNYVGSTVVGDSVIGYEKMISGQIVPQVGDKLSVIGVADYAFSERRIAPRNDNDIIFLSPSPAALPTLAYSSAENKIKVRFNVALNATDAVNTSNYSLSTFESITGATYDGATKTVTLTTGTNLVPSVTPHVLSVSGIRNYQNTPMADIATVSFIGGISTIVFVQTPVSASNDTSQINNQQVSIRGVVTETTGGATPDYPASVGGFYVQQRGATQYAGVFVYGPPTMPVRGDSVFVSGSVQEFGVGPETEITGVDEIAILASNRPPIAPVVYSLANAAGTDPAQGEKCEAMLIKVLGATSLTTGIPGTPFDASQSLAGTDTLRVGDLAVDESGYTPWRGDVVDVIGIIRYFGTAPFRQLQPRIWSEPPTGDIHVVAKAQVSDVPPVALRTQLLQNQPNPFNPSTTIRFTLAAEANVMLRVYTADGRMVRTLFRGVAPAGVSIPVQWNGLDEGGRAVPSGLYFYRLVTPNETQTRKMLLLK